MIKRILPLLFVLSVFVSCKKKETKLADTNTKTIVEKENSQDIKTLYQFKIKTLGGEDFDMNSLKGKKVMIVNTASKCGLTPQYKDLQKLYDTFKDDGFIIIGFPANNFAEQEPGTPKEIATFCKENYGVTFPMMEKISVKGDTMHPLYQFLTQQAASLHFGSEVVWNFQKYLLDERGKLVKVVPSKILPTNQDIIDWIKS